MIGSWIQKVAGRDVSTIRVIAFYDFLVYCNQASTLYISNELLLSIFIFLDKWRQFIH